MVGRGPASPLKALTLFILAAIPALASATEAPWRVVILSGTDPTLPAFVAIDRAMRGALNSPRTHPIELYLESLDAMRFPGGQIEPQMVALLKSKYANEHIDAVLAVAPAGLAFAGKHRDEIWPGAAIVFHSVAEAQLRGRALPPRTTGVPVQFDIAGTANLALRLRPSTRRLVVIGGSGDYDRYVVAIAKEQLGTHRANVDVEYWMDRSIDDLAQAVSGLPADAAVIILSIGRDVAGRTFTARDAAALLARAASAPMFGIYDTFLGAGIVAGMVDNYAWRGERVARLLVDTLESKDGATPSTLAVVPSECVADARELSRWDIATSRLPSGCTVQFGEPSALQRYRWQIATAFAIIASQTVLIAALILQRRRRRNAEIESQAARTELTHAARLASMGELTASIAHEIKQPLSAILAHADTAELLLEADAPSLPEIQRILAEIRKDDLRASDVITRLRELLGKHAMESRTVDLNGTVTDTLAMLEAEARRRDVSVATHLSPGLPPIVGDRVHLQQVVLNLVLNAMDAVTGGEGPARRITVGTMEVADGVALTVTDNGPGVDPAIAPRLFESFATTKSHGLGLGLSIARTIVEAHGGTIRAAGNVPNGAVFRGADALQHYGHEIG